MGSELVAEDAPPSYTEQFYEVFPFYLSIGMTYEQFWLGDCELPKYYRKAYRIRIERDNHSAWLQGGYIYDALCAVSPVFHAFAKRGTKPAPYHKEPYKFKASETGADKPSKTSEEIQEIQALNASAKFSSFVTQWNKRFEGEGGEPNGTDNR